jgi:hypothetical protein
MLAEDWQEEFIFLPIFLLGWIRAFLFTLSLRRSSSEAALLGYHTLFYYFKILAILRSSFAYN